MVDRIDARILLHQPRIRIPALLIRKRQNPRLQLLMLSLAELRILCSFGASANHIVHDRTGRSMVDRIDARISRVQGTFVVGGRLGSARRLGMCRLRSS
jgi:hypothetical protein